MVCYVPPLCGRKSSTCPAATSLSTRIRGALPGRRARSRGLGNVRKRLVRRLRCKRNLYVINGLYYGMDTRILVFDPSGNFVREFGSMGFAGRNHPSSRTWDTVPIGSLTRAASGALPGADRCGDRRWPLRRHIRHRGHRATRRNRPGRHGCLHRNSTNSMSRGSSCDSFRGTRIIPSGCPFLALLDMVGRMLRFAT